LSPNTYFRLSTHFWGRVLSSEGTIRKTKDGLIITNTNVEYLEKLKNSIDGILGRLNLEIKPYSRIPNGGTRKAYYLSLSFIFSDILMKGLKLDPGNKIQVDAALPKLYLSLSAKNSSHVKTVAALLRWLFSGDGWITVFRDHLGQTHRIIGISFSKSVKNPADKRPPKLLSQTSYLLKKFFDIEFNGPYLDKVHSYTTPNGKRTTAQWKIFIRGYSNLKKFYKKIGFVEDRKNELLNRALNSYERPKLGDGESLRLVAKIASEMKCVTAPDIAKKTKLSLSWVERLLKWSAKEGHLRVMGGGQGCKNGGRTPYVYEWVGGQTWRST
ncbi:MAG: hypothetical protein ACE5OT_04210, partial [Candidatus Hadarchaeaceae archaeon]